MRRSFSLLSGLGLILISLLFIGAPCPAVAFLPQNTKITFDTTNTLIFEDVGRHDGFSGDHILLHVTQNEQQFDIDFADIMKSNSVPLSSQVDEIRYRDKDRIWIISRLGRLMDGAVLFNLATQKVEWHRGGVYFSLSPDARHVAYSYSINKHYECPMVFVNIVMVYPRVIPGFTGPGRLNGPEMEDGTRAYKFIAKNDDRMNVASAITWINNGEIQFTVRPSDTNTSASANQTIRITGLEDLQKPEQIKVSAVPSAPKPSRIK